MSFSLQAQITEILEEDEVPPMLVVKHFENFPDCEMDQWSKLEAEGETNYIVSFEENSLVMMARISAPSNVDRRTRSPNSES